MPVAESASMNVLRIITIYGLTPIWFALLVFLLTEISVKRHGINLREGVKLKTSIFAGVTALLWLAAIWIPSSVSIPNLITVELLIGIIAAITTLQLLVFYFSEMFAPEDTLRELGIGSGIANMKLAFHTAVKLFHDDADTVKDGTALVLLSNATLILRNFLAVIVIAIFSKEIGMPPVFFWASMLTMVIGALIAYIIFHKKSQQLETEEYSFFSPKDTIISILIFLVIFYSSVWAIGKSIPAFYGILTLTGLMYGSVPALVIIALFLSKKITADLIFSSMIIGTIASLLSPILFSFIANARKLGIYLLVNAAIAVIGACIFVAIA